MSLRNILRLSSLLLALSIGTTASAQSNSTGNITGEAKAGDKVMIFNPDTGMKREIDVKKDGKFRVRSLPTGNYQVTLQHADGTVGPTHGAVLRVGTTAYIPAETGADAQTPPPAPAPVPVPAASSAEGNLPD